MIKGKKTILFFGIASISLLLSYSPATGTEQKKTVNKNTIEIHVDSERKISGNSIRLKDIATISGNDKKITGRIADIEIIRRLPSNVTKQVIIKKNQITARLRQQRIDLKNITIISPKKILLTREYNTIEPEQIRLIIENFLYEQLHLSKDQTVISKIVTDPITVPGGQISLTITSNPKNMYIGQTTFKVQISINNKKWKTIRIKAFIDRYQDVIVSAENFKKGGMISEENILLKRMNVTRLQNTFYTEKEDVVGKMVARDMQPNNVIRKKDIKIFYPLKNGDKVMIVAESPTVKVSTVGIAKEKGEKGDRIKVLNIHSKKHIIAQVLDGQTVLVGF